MTAGLVVVQPCTARVKLSDHIDAPAKITITASDHRGFYVEIVLQGRWGGFDCTQVQVSQQQWHSPVTGEALRSIALGEILAEAAEHVAFDDTNDILLRVAALYMVAESFGLPPTKAVQTALAVSRATAARRVASARAAGYLPRRGVQ